MVFVLIEKSEKSIPGTNVSKTVSALLAVMTFAAHWNIARSVAQALRLFPSIPPLIGGFFVKKSLANGVITISI